MEDINCPIIIHSMGLFLQGWTRGLLIIVWVMVLIARSGREQEVLGMSRQVRSKQQPMNDAQTVTQTIMPSLRVHP